MTLNTLYDRVRLAREGSAVERAHVHPHLMRYSVGHHSLDAVTLLTLCWQEDHGGALPRSELLVAAAFHDIPERITGDLPKWVAERTEVVLGPVETHVLEGLGVRVTITAEEATYLDAADRIELWLWSMEEGRRGNTGFFKWVRHYDVHFRASPPPPAFEALMKAYRARGCGRMNVRDETEAAGL